MSPAPESRSAWLAEHLKELMESPHVHLTEGGAEMAPGPVDMFSTRFDAMFMPDAHAILVPDHVDRHQLKECLLGLQRRWNDKAAVCKGVPPHEVHDMEFHPDMAAKMEFTPLFMYPAHQETVMAEAKGAMMEGQERVSELMLEGDPALFRHECEC
ncbi:hypothetical protein NM688_g8867 [Phlebia brevispora]|uniref:Uncharacterized protein n=1 Tax=Phlebia brevispora TaxID=194682 RepID=A0ACC1RP44_9APHY|nr:hypothetical protein NM688_g8867 [Phlebia brevispora]